MIQYPPEIHEKRSKHARAKAAAADIEKALLAAESRHAQAVAQALSDGLPPPAKPAKLSELQAADAATDEALQLLEDDANKAMREHRSQVAGEAVAMMRGRIELRDTRVRRAVRVIAAALAVLSDENVSNHELTQFIMARIDTLRRTDARGYNATRAEAFALAGTVEERITEAVSRYEGEAPNPMLEFRDSLAGTELFQSTITLIEGE